jgi:hypothetical protein
MSRQYRVFLEAASLMVRLALYQGGPTASNIKSTSPQIFCDPGICFATRFRNAPEYATQWNVVSDLELTYVCRHRVGR